MWKFQQPIETLVSETVASDHPHRHTRIVGLCTQLLWTSCCHTRVLDCLFILNLDGDLGFYN